MVSCDKTAVLTSRFLFLFRVRTAQSKRAFPERLSTEYRVQRGRAGRSEQPQLRAAGPPARRRPRAERAADRGRKPGRRGGQRGGRPKSPPPRTRRPSLGPAPPPPCCLRLRRRVPAPGSLVRTGAPLTHREGIYVAASSLLTDARRWGPQTSYAAPAAAPRRPRQL